ncbi:MAG: type II toxin-antitoxin system RelE/ParE family toxin [Saprospiraceae bacterium]
MERTLKYSKRVLQQINRTLAYIDENLSSQGADALLEQIEGKMKRAKSYPEAGKLSAKSRNIRYVLIDRHRRLYYRYSDRRVTVLALFDTRQDPRKQPY